MLDNTSVISFVKTGAVLSCEELAPSAVKRVYELTIEILP